MADELSSMDEEQNRSLREELVNLDRLFTSGQSECNEVTTQYRELNEQVDSILNQNRQQDEPDLSRTTTALQQELVNQREAEMSKYRTHISACKETQDKQSEIITDLTNRILEYRRKCERLETVLAEYPLFGLNASKDDSNQDLSQNETQLSLVAMQLKYEQEQNKHQGLQEVHKLTKKQLEMYVVANKALVADVENAVEESKRTKKEFQVKERAFKNEEQDNLADIQRLKSEVLRLRKLLESERTDLNFRIEKLTSLLEVKQKVLDEKDRTIDSLNRTIEASHTKDLRSDAGILMTSSTPEKRCCTALKEIGNILLTDADHNTWANIFRNDITVIRNFLLTSTPHSLANICDNREFVQSVITAVQNSLYKRCVQVGELNLKLSGCTDQVQAFKKQMKNLEVENQTSKDTVSLLNEKINVLKSKIKELNEEKQSNRLVRSESHGFLYDMTQSSLNLQMESLNSEIDRLSTANRELIQKTDQLEWDKQQATSLENSLNSDLRKSNKKITVIEDQLAEIEKLYQETRQKVQKLTVDKELLEQEKEEFTKSIKKLGNQRTDLDSNVHRMNKESESLKSSLQSLQNLNESLQQEKDELTKTLTKETTDHESTRQLLSKEKANYGEACREIKDRLDVVQQSYTEIKTEKEKLEANLDAIELLKSELEQSQEIIVKRNNELIIQVTKLSEQKSILEVDLDATREELIQRSENSQRLDESRGNLTREKAELIVRADLAENELSRLSGLETSLREEKEALEKSLYSSQNLTTLLQEDKRVLETELEDYKSRVQRQQDQLEEVKRSWNSDTESSARKKDSLNRKVQQLEEGYAVMMKNAQQKYQSDLDLSKQEKESQRFRLEAAYDELSKKRREEIDELIHKHTQEILTMRKQMSLHERELEERMGDLVTQKAKLEKTFSLEKASLVQNMQALQNKLSDAEQNNIHAGKTVAASVEHYKSLSKELEAAKEKMKAEMENMTSVHNDRVKKLREEVQELQKQRDSAYDDMNNLTADLNTSILEKKKFELKLQEISTTYNSAIKDHGDLERNSLLYQQKLGAEKKNVDTLVKSLEDLKARLKQMQSENNELKQALQQAKFQITGLENNIVEHVDDNRDMRDTLRELEASRLSCRRESQNLRRNLVVLEATHESKDREMSEMQALLARREEIENEFKVEMSKLKQKISETESTKDNMSRDVATLKGKLQATEQRLVQQHEEYNASLQESLLGERSLAEQRLTYERAMSETTEEIQELRMKFNHSEGKVAALQNHVTKLEGVKQELENKLYALNQSVRSLLRLRSDSGFQGSSSQLLMSPCSSNQNSPGKLSGRHSGLLISDTTPLRDHLPTSTSTPLRQQVVYGSMDLDADLVKSALQDFVQKFHNSEKEKDDLKIDFSKLQRNLDTSEIERSSLLQKLKSLQTEVEITAKGKKDVESQLTSCKTTIFTLEDNIQNLQTAKRNLSDENSNLHQAITTLEMEMSNSQGKLAEMRHNESKLKQEILMAIESKDVAESKLNKFDAFLQELNIERNDLQQTLTKRQIEMESLQEELLETKKAFHIVEERNNSLRLSTERLSAQVQNLEISSKQWQQKFQDLTNIHSEAMMQSHQLNKDLLQLKRDHKSCESEKNFVKTELEHSRRTLSDLRKQTDALNEKLENFAEKTSGLELEKAELEGQMLGYKNVLTYKDEYEKDTSDRISALENEKFLLEQQLNKLHGGLGKNEQFRLKSEKQKNKFEKENTLLRKALDKHQKEHQKAEEIASRTNMERTALGKSLSKMEIENQQLSQKVQTLQSQLADLEQRHAGRVQDLDNKQKRELMSELENLKVTKKNSEEDFASKVQFYQKKILSLEQQVETLKDHLKTINNSWNQSPLPRTASVSFLNDLNSSNQRSDSSRDLHSPLATPLNGTHGYSSPIIMFSPNMSSKSPSSSRTMTSTPQARRRLDKSFPS